MTEPPGESRSERDSLGDILVPAHRLWGAQTQRCLMYLSIGGDHLRWPRSVIRAFGIVKKCAAQGNRQFGTLPADKVKHIVAAAQEVIDGKLDVHFPLGPFQSGSGTQSNMNANEVIANRAIQLSGGTIGSKSVHPNDDVNRSQSSNDVFPTVMHLATVEEIDSALIPAVSSLHDAFAHEASASADLVMLGRTHLQDAVPITFGQVVSGWAAQIAAAIAALRNSLGELYELPLGGTAVGTGLNAPAGFGDAVIKLIAAETARPFVPAANRFAALSAHDAMVTASAALRRLSAALMKIANDIRWYASGPRGGIGELLLPVNEPGSSIMPGKVNPTQCEMLTQVAVQVFGHDHAVAFAGSQGSFQLNTFKPVILHNVLESVRLLAGASRSFEEHCVKGILPDRGRIREHLKNSLMLVTALTPHIGYENAARIAQTAHREGITLLEAGLKLGLVTRDQFEAWVRPARMTQPD